MSQYIVCKRLFASEPIFVHEINSVIHHEPIMSALSNPDSLNNKQGTFKPSVGPEGPMTDKGASRYNVSLSMKRN